MFKKSSCLKDLKIFGMEWNYPAHSDLGKTEIFLLNYLLSLLFYVH